MKKLAPFLLLAGCAGGVDQPARVATALVEAVPVVDASGRAAYERELTACPAEPPEAEAECVTRVEAAWKPFIDAMQTIRGVICAGDPQKPECVK